MSGVFDDSPEEKPLEADGELQEIEKEGNSEDQLERVDQELLRIRERRENPGKSFLVNSLIPRNNKNIKRLISHFPEDKRPININFMLNSFYQAIRDNPLSTYLAFKQIFNEEQLKLLLNFIHFRLQLNLLSSKLNYFTVRCVFR